jgi:outer membrane receptor protein involved in Fe transport
VTDAQGNAIPSTTLRTPAGQLLGLTDISGEASIPCAQPCSAPIALSVEAPSFAPRKLTWQPGTTIMLMLATDHQTVSVTAYRTPLGALESPVSTRTLTPQDLHQSAPVTLDGQLRQLPGLETFRRSSSLVANPSSQGLSLRGLGSTSASRTLVTEDDVPLNDAFGGWIHWEEVPELSIRSVEVVRGGASDLYGSSAIGGVVNILPQNIPQGTASNLVDLKSSYGSEGTYQSSLLLAARRGPWGALATGGVLGTDGFIQLAPDARGTVDVKSNVHAQNGVVLLDRQQGPVRLFLRSSGMNEARANGTPLQSNATRLWRYSTGSDWNRAQGGILTFRAYGSAEHYRQTFSTIAANRNSETLNRFARTPDDELGLVLHWSQPLLPHLFGPGLLFVVGSDTHDVRALDEETVIKSGAQSYIDLSDRQRQTGAYAELLFTHLAWTFSASGRFDWFSNFDSRRVLPAAAALPTFSEQVFDPRLGLSRKIGQHFALSATGFRAYRAPTPNELYRSTQVGSLLTLPNNNLRSERATGWETGLAMEQTWGTVRASYFWTRVNRPITALTTSPNSNPIQLTRENLGQIESRGVSLDFEAQPVQSMHWMTIQGGYQYTNATVTQYLQQPALVGNWIPQVAHNTGTLQLRGYKPAIGTLSLQSRMSGHQFDDDANTYLLHSYFKLDAYASHELALDHHALAHRMEIFTSAENLFDRSIEVGRTPTLTLANPRTLRVGFNFKLSPAAR